MIEVVAGGFRLGRSGKHDDFGFRLGRSGTQSECHLRRQGCRLPWAHPVVGGIAGNTNQAVSEASFGLSGGPSALALNFARLELAVAFMTFGPCGQWGSIWLSYQVGLKMEMPTRLHYDCENWPSLAVDLTQRPQRRATAKRGSLVVACPNAGDWHQAF